MKPIYGYRFVVKGDFDGDGKNETLTEHYYSRIENRETNKYYDSIDYSRLVEITVKKKPLSFVTCDNKKIDTLFISAEDQLLGLLFLRNEGDLDGDGGDEVSYVINAADWSAVNLCYLVSYKNNRWVTLLSFDIREWQLPDLPYVQSQYSPFGVAGLQATVGSDSINEQLEKKLNAFPGFITKLKNGKIKVRTFTYDVCDSTAIIDLKKISYK